MAMSDVVAFEVPPGVFNATRACGLLVGLPAVNVLEVVESLVGRLELTVESILSTPSCPNCGEQEGSARR